MDKTYVVNLTDAFGTLIGRWTIGPQQLNDYSYPVSDTLADDINYEIRGDARREREKNKQTK